MSKDDQAKPVTQEDLAEWRAKTEAATEGPWKLADEEPHRTPISLWVASIWSAGAEHQVLLHRGTSWEPKRSDFEFIATAREAMPRLLAEVAELKRMMVYCNRCSSAPGEECASNCTRDGSRDC